MHGKHHKFSHTHVEHHKDGSHTVSHVHEDGSHGDVKHAVADLDGLHDSLQDHLGAPNPGEAQANAGMSGVPEPVASGAGVPPSAMPASM